MNYSARLSERVRARRSRARRAATAAGGRRRGRRRRVRGAGERRRPVDSGEARRDFCLARRPRRESAGLTVRVTPPAYTKRKPQVFDDPVQVSVIAGSAHSSRLRPDRGTGVGCDEIRRHRASSRQWTAEVSPRDRRARRASGCCASSRQERTRRLRSRRAASRSCSRAATIWVSSSLALRFTKASGGGENLSFTEGEVPLRLDRRSEQQWNGAGQPGARVVESGRRRHRSCIARSRATPIPAGVARAVRAVPDRDRQERRRLPMPGSRCRRRKRSTPSASRW